jgi:hypothetical protein
MARAMPDIINAVVLRGRRHTSDGANWRGLTRSRRIRNDVGALAQRNAAFRVFAHCSPENYSREFRAYGARKHLLDIFPTVCTP